MLRGVFFTHWLPRYEVRVLLSLPRAHTHPPPLPHTLTHSHPPSQSIREYLESLPPELAPKTLRKLFCRLGATYVGPRDQPGQRLCGCAFMSSGVCEFVRLCVCVRVYVSVYVCVYHLHTHTHTHTHAHTHTHITHHTSHTHTRTHAHAQTLPTTWM